MLRRGLVKLSLGGFSERKRKQKPTKTNKQKPIQQYFFVERIF